MITSQEWMPKPLIFQRNYYDVKAVKVTEDNIYQVARWCGGEVRKKESLQFTLYSENYDFDSVPNGELVLLVPIVDGHLTAYFTDWVVRDEFGKLQVFTHEVFKESFRYSRSSEVQSNVNQESFDF